MEEETQKMSWYLVYCVAIFIDCIGILTGIFGIGLVLSRILGIFVGSGFALWFYGSGIKHWGWKLFIGGGTEEIPLVGDFLPLWTIMVWRIHRANSTDTALETAEQNEASGNYQEQET